MQLLLLGFHTDDLGQVKINYLHKFQEKEHQMEYGNSVKYLTPQNTFLEDLEQPWCFFGKRLSSTKLWLWPKYVLTYHILLHLYWIHQTKS